MNKTEQDIEIKRSVWPRIAVCVLILTVAGSIFILLAKSKKPPQKKTQQERPIQVEAVVAARSDFQVSLTSHGELQSIRTVTLSAEVAGTILKVHPDLQSGEVIPKGAVLIEIDDADYRTEYDFNLARQKYLENDLELAQKELERVKNLFNKNKVGSIASVEASQRAVNSAGERLALLEQAIKKAKINLDRCRIYAPFTCRIISSHVEEGQYVSPGMEVAVLADDSILEVELPLYGKEAVDWLRIDHDKLLTSNWFGRPERVSITLNWTESPEILFTSTLDRIATYNPATRSLKIVAQISPDTQHKPFQLVSGMFVRAAIPGKPMTGVIELPRAAVSFENQVLVIRENRLYSSDVEVIKVQNDHAYIGRGINEGDIIITTRLADPLEGSLVEIINLENEASQ